MEERISERRASEDEDEQVRAIVKIIGCFLWTKKKKKKRDMNMCDFLLFDRFYCDSVLGKIMIIIY